MIDKLKNTPFDTKMAKEYRKIIWHSYLIITKCQLIKQRNKVKHNKRDCLT